MIPFHSVRLLNAKLTLVGLFVNFCFSPIALQFMEAAMADVIQGFMINTCVGYKRTVELTALLGDFCHFYNWR